ncbi:hypothetical protein [Streptomyces sp. AP-93]|nr:hypothetical protein [Streptomyces sp. AP-93]
MGPVSLHPDGTVMPYADSIFAFDQIQPGWHSAEQLDGYRIGSH